MKKFLFLLLCAFSLYSIELRIQEPIVDDQFLRLLICHPKSNQIKDVYIEYGQELTDLSLLALSKLCPSLRSVSIVNGKFTDKGIEYIVARCTNLRKLFIPTEDGAVTDYGIEILTILCSELEGINLGGHASVTDKGVILLSQRCPNLKTFLMPTLCGKLTDESLYALADFCHNLENLDVSGHVRVTFDGAFSVVGNCVNLKNMWIRETSVGQFEKQELTKLRPQAAIYGP